MKPIGIYGGTFDPVHFGHIWPVLEVREKTGICEVRYIPNSVPPHRGAPKADAVHRLNMLALALKNYPELIVDDREFMQAGRSRMVPTLRSLRSEFNFRPLCLILGIDAFLQIEKWYFWNSILSLAQHHHCGAPWIH